VRVGLLHGRVLLGKERAVYRDCQDAGCAMRSGGRKRDGNLPDGGAVFRGLAVVEAQLLERLGE
jgi:hypothetical protein